MAQHVTLADDTSVPGALYGKALGTAANPIITGGSDGKGGIAPAPNALVSASDLASAVVNYATSGDHSIVTAVAGQTTRVHRIRLNVAAANVLTIKDGTGMVLEVLNFTGAGFLNYDFSTRPWYITAASSAFVINMSVANQLNGVVEYVTSA